MARDCYVSSSQVAKWGSLPPNQDIFMIAHDMSFATPEHRHDYYELCFTIDGTMLNVVGDRRLYMLDNSLCVMNLESTHRLEIIDPSTVVINIGLRPHLFQEGIFKDFLASGNFLSRFLRGESSYDYLMFSDSGSRSLRGSVFDFVKTYASSGHRQSFAVAAKTLLLLDELSKTPAHSFYGIDKKTVDMLRYIRENFATVSASSLAKEFGYSANYCTQYIRKHTGFTITELIEDARISCAEGLLSTTDMNIETIAHTVGYKGCSRFYEVFRRRHGMTPSDYRTLGRCLDVEVS